MRFDRLGISVGTCCAIFSQFTRCSLTTFTTCSHSLRCALPPQAHPTHNLCTPVSRHVPTDTSARHGGCESEVGACRAQPQRTTASESILTVPFCCTRRRQARQTTAPAETRLPLHTAKRHETHLKVTAKLVPNRFHVTEYIGRSFGVEQRKLLRCTAAAYEIRSEYIGQRTLAHRRWSAVTATPKQH